MIGVHCWQTLQCKNALHVEKLDKAGIKGLRIFFNLCDVPKMEKLSETSSDVMWQSYINHCFAIMPNGCHSWTHENFYKPFNSAPIEDMMRDAFELCRKYNWLPIVCMGYQEELPYNWIGRAPSADKWKWLGRFAKEVGVYLKRVYQFQRIDLEIWNEPSKLTALGFGYDKYSKLAYEMAKGWLFLGEKNKCHIFSDNLEYQYYFDGMMQNVDLMKLPNIYVSTHCLTHDEWNSNPFLVDVVNQKIAKYPHIKQCLTEMTPMGNWTRMDKLIGKVAMYGLLLAIRNDNIGTAFEVDDLWIYQFNNTNNINCTSLTKEKFLTEYNAKYAKGEEIIMEYLRPDELQAVYDALGIKTPYNANTPNLFVVGKKDPAITVKWADIDALEETRMKALISGLKKIGVLPVNFPNYPNIKYDSLGNYLNNWAVYAKSKPKI